MSVEVVETQIRENLEKTYPGEKLMSLATDVSTMKWLQNTCPWRGRQEKVELWGENSSKRSGLGNIYRNRAELWCTWENKKGIDSGWDTPTLRERSYIKEVERKEELVLGKEFWGWENQPFRVLPEQPRTKKVTKSEELKYVSGNVGERKFSKVTLAKTR